MNPELFSLKTGNTAEFQRRLLEKSLAMRAQAYQSQIKAKLLTQAIMQIENSKKHLQLLNDWPMKLPPVNRLKKRFATWPATTI